MSVIQESIGRMLNIYYVFRTVGFTRYKAIKATVATYFWTIWYKVRGNNED